MTDRMPRRFDVCNGDADGLCAVRQWRLHEPRDSALVTGLKREIELVERVDAQADDEVLVCDISLARNRDAVLRLLEGGVRVRYFDHHVAGEPLSHPGLEAHIDTAPGVCTSVIVDRVLDGRHRRWAVAGAFGDNLDSVARRLAAAAGLSADEVEQLRTLGEAINYNAYGEHESDVLLPPAELYATMARHVDPLAMLVREPLFNELDARRRADLALAVRTEPRWQDERGCVLVLPDEAWSRRVVGCLANELARAALERAHAVLLPANGDTWRVSVRAPIAAPNGAGALCARFGGAGRAAAGGPAARPACRPLNCRAS
ncbi:MAG TPA: hypothetical protein PK177_22170 [Burkholderiaceae bacterium]|nr:hypothetical protein [Burkholderiaceae bacterium]